MNQILAAVVTYNRLNMLKDCVSHIAGQSVPADIMIVDNASTDGTKDWAISAIKEYSESIGPNIRIIYENTGANLGGAGGFNYAMRLSCELGYDYIWIMDDDAFPEPDCLEKLMSAAEDLAAQQANDHTDAPASAPSFGFLSSVVLWTDGSLCKMNWQRKLHLPAKRSEHHLTDQDLLSFSERNIENVYDRLLPIQSATFVSLLFPASVIRKAGLPIKDFFIWCDDIEYTRRISLKNGYPCYCVLDSRIVHHTLTNTGTDIATDTPDRLSRYNYAFRNENYMYRRYGLKGFGYYILVCGFNVFKIIKNAPDNKLKRMGIIFKNFFTGLFFNPPVEKL